VFRVATVDNEWSVNGDGDDGYGSSCVVCVDVLCALLLPFLQQGTYLGVCQHFCGQILWSDFVVRFCPQNFSSTFIEPSAKPTGACALGTN
jgi:hypothetical protein